MKRPWLYLPLAVASLAAEDGVPWASTRFQAGPALSHTTLHASDSTGATQDQDLTWDRSSRMSLLWGPMGRITSRGSGLLLVEVGRTRVVNRRGMLGIDEECYHVGIHQGFAWVLGAASTLELTFYGELGVARPMGESFAGGHIWGVGTRLAASRNLDVLSRTWSGQPVVGVALLAGYGVITDQVKRPSDTYDLTITTRGVAPAAVLGWRW